MKSSTDQTGGNDKVPSGVITMGEAAAKEYGPWGRDLTSGSVHRNIWHLAVPMTLEMGVQNIQQVLDTYWLGRLGSAALAAVTIGGTIMWVINSLATGLGIGGMAVVARRIGGRNRAAADRAAWQTILLGIFVSALMALIGLLSARTLLVLLGADVEVLPLGMAYLRVLFLGIGASVLVFVINSLLRGAGDARLAMTAVFIYVGATVFLEPILVFGPGPLPALGVEGAAMALVLGSLAALLFQVYVLLKGKARVGINLRDLVPDLSLMKLIIGIAWPSTAQMLLRSLSRLVILGLVGAFGTFALAAFGVSNRLLLIALIPCFGLGNAAATLVGQNLGAGKPRQAERSAWWVSAYSTGYMLVAAAILVSFAPGLIALFDPTPEVVSIGVQALHIVAPSMLASAVGVVLARSFDGAGNTVPAMAINLTTLWGVEILLSFVLSRFIGVSGIFWGRAIANLANGSLFAFWFSLGRWKHREV
ncbi:MAG: hypothetical protein DRI61_17265 [Chloroflexi bacterium]|nr:MAG: hypothetical protein DRI61_17265 [Chloroflexota bacterium]